MSRKETRKGRKRRTHAGQDEGTHHHEDGLQQVSVHDGGEAAGNGEHGSHSKQYGHTPVQGSLGSLVHGLLDEERPRVQVYLQTRPLNCINKQDVTCNHSYTLEGAQVGKESSRL